MISPELQKAIECLQINDVYLRNFAASCDPGFDPKYEPSEALTFQTKHFVRESSVVELDHDRQVLRVMIDMGARWIDEGEQGDRADVKACIEAEFVAEYVMKEPLEDASINTFSLNNASYHVWPYWRELLNSQCTRMHLPRVVLNTVQLAQNRGQSPP
jgi:hypothetical protein